MNQADANKAMCLRSACKALQISKSGYYEWRDRVPCKRAVANEQLTQQIKEVHAMSDATRQTKPLPIWCAASSWLPSPISCGWRI